MDRVYFLADIWDRFSRFLSSRLSEHVRRVRLLNDLSDFQIVDTSGYSVYESRVARLAREPVRAQPAMSSAKRRKTVNPFTGKQYSGKHSKILEVRESLPIWESLFRSTFRASDAESTSDHSSL